MPTRRRGSAFRVLLFACVALWSSAALAQDPSRQYFSIHTTHFVVSFTRPLEPFARRVAANAERAYAQLTNELHPPRGRIEILVSDDADISNGSAITYPTNRITIFAAPPVSEGALRFNTDWAQLVITHELTHIFHLDRSRGLWQLGQHVFGRSPFLFPNYYAPSWLVEGLAVYEESRLAGEGRIEGPEHTLIANAVARDRVFPSIGGASLANPRFPFGESAYAYGSLFIDYLARTHGDSSIRKFVESSANAVPPLEYLIDIPAKKAFGTSFIAAWTDWRNSIDRTALVTGAPVTGWQDLTAHGLLAGFPRWLNDSALVYAGTEGRESDGAYALRLNGTQSRIGRRNNASPNVALPDGSLLFSQLELTSPYAEPSDLFVERDGKQSRLTRNQRLLSPDTRADGGIIAIQLVDGASRVVRVSPDGATTTPITAASLDTLWTEPRWSHRGDRIVAVRWLRGGVAQIVVIDTVGTLLHIATSGRVVAAAPSWMADDAGIVYSIAQGASSQIIVQTFLPSAADPSADIVLAPIGPRYSTRTVSMSRPGFALFEPEAPRRSGNSLLAATMLTGTGYHLGVFPCCALAGPAKRDTVLLDLTPDRRLPPLAIDSSPATPYHALGSLIPRFWVPEIEDGIESNSYRLGGYTQGWDILRRHSYYVEVLVPTDHSGIVASGHYDYKGFGLPIITLAGSQNWAAYAQIRNSANALIGTLRRRTRDAEISAALLRQRVRSAASVSVGAGVERHEYRSDPDTLLHKLKDTTLSRPSDFPRLTVSASYATYETPPFAISPEDGFAIAGSARERFTSGSSANGGPTTSLVGTVALYKSLDLPGYAHHVLALRGAAAWSDTKASGYYEIGGTSGSSFQVIPGYAVGEGRQTFPVRGFPAGSVLGIQAIGGSAEYRAPLSLTHHTLGLLPTFLQRSTVTFFGDGAYAGCPNVVAARPVCNVVSSAIDNSLASVGAEFGFNAGVLSWDSAFRFHIGLAKPVFNRSYAARSLTFYLTSGASF